MTDAANLKDRLNAIHRACSQQAPHHRNAVIGARRLGFVDCAAVVPKESALDFFTCLVNEHRLPEAMGPTPHPPRGLLALAGHSRLVHTQTPKR